MSIQHLSTVCLLLCGLLVSTFAFAACGLEDELVEKVGSERDRVVSADNLRNLTVLLVERSIMKGWPPYSGKRFVLSPVAFRHIDVRNAENLEVLFSPAAMPDPMPTPEDYEAVNRESLESGDFGHLTSFAGRRNADPEHKLTAEMLKRVVPVMADVSMPGYAVIAYSDGSVRVKKAEDFGLPAGTQITVGDDANVEELKALSLD